MLTAFHKFSIRYTVVTVSQVYTWTVYCSNSLSSLYMDSDEGIKEAGAEDDLIDAVYNYLTSKKYPDCCAPCKKRQIRKKAEKFLLVKG